MSPIPPDHTAGRDLKQQFAALDPAYGRPVARARSRTRRVAVTASVAVAGFAAAAGASKVFVFDSDTVGHDPEGTRAIQRSPGDARLSPARASDPISGPAWGARTYVDARGESCVLVGRVRHGELGSLSHAVFRPYGPSAPGECAALSDPAVYVRQYPSPSGPRAVLFGIVTRDIRAITLTHRGRSTLLTVAPDGVFIRVRRGLNAYRGDTLTLRTARGQVTHRLR